MMWDALIDNAEALAWVVANPGSGCGLIFDPTWELHIGRLESAGVQVIGYVDSGYGSRTPEELERELRTWREWYGIDGVFLDRAPSSGGRWLRDWTSVSGSVPVSYTVANSGTCADPRLRDVFDEVCDYEGSWRDLYAHGPCTESAAGTCKIVYGAASDKVISVATELSKHADTIWVTDRNGVNPYDGLPAAFAELASEIVSIRDASHVLSSSL